VNDGGRRRPNAILFTLGGAFLLVMVSIVIGALNRPEALAFEVSAPRLLDSTGTHQVTLDATSERDWRYFDFSGDSVWDVAVQRFHVRVNDSGGSRDLERWYTYSWTSHLLTSKGHVYGVRTADGRHATLEIVSYYCPGARPGCVTIRYRLSRTSLPASPREG
jgi:hypothetical protein